MSFLHYFLYAFIAIFPMVNPVAMSSAFFSVTEHATDAQRKKLAMQVSIYGVILLLGSLLFGPLVLNFFGLQTADIKVAGGLVVFSIAWKMLLSSNEPDQASITSGKHSGDAIMALAFFPLTMPLTAGAGSIAIVVALASQAKTTDDSFVQYLSIALAIVAIFMLVFACYRYSSLIFTKLGRNGAKVISSLSAFILLAIGVSLVWSGIQLLIQAMAHS